MAGLAAIRRNALLTQRELADLAGVAQSTVEDVENGTKRRTFTAKTMKKIAAALGLTVHEIDEFRAAIQLPGPASRSA
jgi:transcriptional regulator with XRE-family HTH domain